MIDQRKLWSDALREIELNVSKANFVTWFKNTSIYKIDSNIVVISVPSAFVRDWLLNKYHKFILKALRETLSSVRGVEYVIHKTGEPRKTYESRPMMRTDMNINPNLGLDSLYINKDDNLNPKYTFESLVVGSFNET
ncbi:MAG: DnaA N-terminal domain-containing protein, partial [Candidatus Paceibacterota bacterium]